MPLPQGINERRQDCIEHEQRIDEVAAELKKHGGWWKVIGAGLVVGIGVLTQTGTSINSKLDSINSKLSAYEVSSAKLEGRVENCEKELRQINDRHNFQDQNNYGKKVR